MFNIFQSHEWEEFKLKTGYQKSYWIDGILVLQKNLPLGYSMLYSPMVGEGQWSVVSGQKFMEEIKRISKLNDTLFYRLELNIPQTTNHQPPTALGFAKAFEEMQPEHTLILDLTKTEEDILAQMKQKGRYNIKIAEQNNVLIKKTDKTDDFYKLYSETAKRHRITYRGKSYFDALLEILGGKGYARLYTASVNQSGAGGQGSVETTSHKPQATNQILAAAIMVYSADTAIYMFGASSDVARNVMAPYLLHWKMISDAKAEGCNKYDFFGIAPDDNPKHPWAGVTRFKKQFGGEEAHNLGSYDLILKPAMYQIFKIAEKIRR